MSKRLPALLTLLVLTPLASAGPDDDARAALALAVPARPAAPDPPPVPPPRPDCCSPECTCGCQEGGPCRCRDLPSPTWTPPPAITLPATRPVPAATYRALRRSRGGC